MLAEIVASWWRTRRAMRLSTAGLARLRIRQWRALQPALAETPALAQLAVAGNSDRFRLPRPMTDRPGLDFSFSGLKTFALNTWQNSAQNEQDRADIARAFEDAAVDTLLIKCRRALHETGQRRLVIAGGVGANRCLRERLGALAKEQGAQVFFPRPALCTDNGAMIAYAGYCRLAVGQADDTCIRALARWPLDTLSPV